MTDKQPNAETEASEIEEEIEGVVEPIEVAEGEEEQVKLLEDARSKADEHWDLYLRTKADVENMRRRAERDVQNAHKFGSEKLIGDLLPVLDSLELGMTSVNLEGADEAVAKLHEGMELTAKMLLSVLEKSGIVAVNPMGEAFNPEFHQAMSMQETPDAAPNTVLVVMQKGYTLNERLVRPAMVVVSKAPAK